MAAEILTQPTSSQRDSSFAELALLYGDKAVREAQARLQVVLAFKSLKPKTVASNDQRIPSPTAEELARKAGISLGTLWGWYRLYHSAYDSAQGNVHLKARAGFEALIPRHRGRAEEPSSDRRYRVDEELRRAIGGLYARRKRPSITKVWRKLVARCPQCRVRSLEPRVRGYQGKNRLHFCPECEFSLSYSTVRRIVRSLPPSLRLLGREGTQAFQNRFGIYIPRS